MTFATNIFVVSESPESYSILRREEAATSESLLNFVETSSSVESFESEADSDIEMDEQFVTYQTLNDCPNQQESLIDNDDDDDGSESDASIIRENSDDSLFAMLSTVGFSIKKRVTFKPMVKVIHFESAELAQKYAIKEEERRRIAKINEESKSFVSGVKFFVGNNFDGDDYEDDY
uniref:Uncharacterized protein n=1 Tax=Panagrolaimus superbus TaxID=310955 RepID=A0A914Y3M3_9BILA